MWHERQPEVYEFIDGVPRLIAPGSKAHSLIKGNVYAALRAQLRGSGCHVIVDGAQIEGKTFSVIPDVVVSCDPLDLSTPRVDDPMFIVEILSPATERDDIGRKLTLYLGVPSLRHYPRDPPGPAPDCPPRAARRPRRRVPHQDRPARPDPPNIALAFDDVYEGVPLGPAT